MQKTKKPHIGITGPNKGGYAAWFFTSLSVWLSGGIPLRIRPSQPKPIERLQALIIGGGADVDPQAYEQDNFIDEYLDATLKNKKITLGQRISSFMGLLIYPIIFLARKLFSRKSQNLDKERDLLEFKLVDEAVKKGIPLLGICRGAQLINVYFKGNLYQDIKSFYLEEPHKDGVFPVKKVFLKTGSKLARILGVDELKVNALHNQAVKTVGDNIQIVAEEPNGIVQAIESSAHYFIIGVQWHPEYLITQKVHRQIFRSLVERAKAVANATEATQRMVNFN